MENTQPTETLFAALCRVEGPCAILPPGSHNGPAHAWGVVRILGERPLVADRRPVGHGETMRAAVEHALANLLRWNGEPVE